DCDAQSDKSNSNNNNGSQNNMQKLIHGETTGRSSRRKQLAPRSRLVRQCEECDFSSSIINEFKTHMKFEHRQEQVFLCDICRYYSLSSFEYQLHLNSHQTNNQPLTAASSSSSSSTVPATATTVKSSLSSNGRHVESEAEIEDDDSINIYTKEQNSMIFENDEQISDDEQSFETRNFFMTSPNSERNKPL
ncbi:unnamed protein product, partial [Adineta ricciae]